MLLIFYFLFSVLINIYVNIKILYTSAFGNKINKVGILLMKSL